MEQKLPSKFLASSSINIPVSCHVENVIAEETQLSRGKNIQKLKGEETVITSFLG